MKNQFFLALIFATISQITTTNPFQQFANKISTSRPIQACTQKTFCKAIAAWTTVSATMMVNGLAQEIADSKNRDNKLQPTTKLREVPTAIKTFCKNPICFVTQVAAYPFVTTYYN